MTRGAVFTLPNSISLSRLVLALGFVLIQGSWERVAIIVVAGFTDFIDGWIARHEKEETETGALIDPLADRIFVFVAISAYLVEGRLTAGQYFIFLARDIATAVGFLIAKIIPWLRPAVFRARMLGKIVTVLQLIALVAVLIVPQSTQLLVIAIGAVAAASIADYTVALWRARTR
jgi:phosphatidylglycerophosphate synthase